MSNIFTLFQVMCDQNDILDAKSRFLNELDSRVRDRSSYPIEVSVPTHLRYELMTWVRGKFDLTTVKSEEDLMLFTVYLPVAKPPALPKKYHVRYNTHHVTSDRPDLVWRVFEDGAEFLVREVNIRSPLFTEKTVEHGVDKYNIATLGYMAIIDDVATITERPDADS